MNGAGADVRPRFLACDTLSLRTHVVLAQPALQPLSSEKPSGATGQPCLCAPRIGAVFPPGPSSPTLELRLLSFLMLEESGETRWGQGPLLILFQVSPWIIRDLAVSNSEKGEELNPEAGEKVAGNGGRQREGGRSARGTQTA